MTAVTFGAKLILLYANALIWLRSNFLVGKRLKWLIASLDDENMSAAREC